MSKTSSTTNYSVLELMQIMLDIKEHGTSVCVRFRLLGEMWQPNMMRVVSVTENRVMLNDETSNKLISIDAGSVMQFEIDNKFKFLRPFVHYDVTPG
jgi:hypothetical protein